jgi:hypothetical protein
LPLFIFWLARLLRYRLAYLPRFFAGFCLVANGIYIGAGGPAGVGDARDMLSYGCPLWVLIVFGIATVAPGLYLWHGLGPRFGLKPSRGGVDVAAVWLAWGLLVLVVGSGLLVHLWLK